MKKGERVVYEDESVAYIFTYSCSCHRFHVDRNSMDRLTKPRPDSEISKCFTGCDRTHSATTIPEQYIPVYQEAAETYGIPWTLFAAHHRIETRFSTMDPLLSPVGAEGHMQFMPCTFVGWSYRDTVDWVRGKYLNPIKQILK